jgi:hypothetical protein
MLVSNVINIALVSLDTSRLSSKLVHKSSYVTTMPNNSEPIKSDRSSLVVM